MSIPIYDNQMAQISNENSHGFKQKSNEMTVHVYGNGNKSMAQWHGASQWLKYINDKWRNGIEISSQCIAGM